MANRVPPLLFKGSRSIPNPQTARASIRELVGKARAQVEAGDYERAHLHEKEALVTALYLIAIGGFPGDQAARLADEALKTVDIDYPRYCA